MITTEKELSELMLEGFILHSHMNYEYAPHLAYPYDEGGGLYQMVDKALYEAHRA